MIVSVCGVSGEIVVFVWFDVCCVECVCVCVLK